MLKVLVLGALVVSGLAAVAPAPAEAFACGHCGPRPSGGHIYNSGRFGNHYIYNSGRFGGHQGGYGCRFGRC